MIKPKNKSSNTKTGSTNPKLWVLFFKKVFEQELADGKEARWGLWEQEFGETEEFSCGAAYSALNTATFDLTQKQIIQHQNRLYQSQTMCVVLQKGF